MRRDQRLREIRKNLRDRYDDQSQPTSSSQNNTSPISSPKTRSQTNTPRKVEQSIPEPVQIPVEHINPQMKESNISSFNYRSTPTSMDTKDRRYRSRTVEVNQTRSVDNQIYGNGSSKQRDQPLNRSEAHRNRHQRLSYRRSSEDTQDKQSHIRRHNDSFLNDNNEIWFEIGQEHWKNLLEHGWRPTVESTGVNLISFTDEGNISRTRKEFNTTCSTIH